MGAVIWGLLGPESVGSERRTRTLNLGATVRSFNDLAVPGMGGVWFGKQLFLATLGVAVAEQARAARRRVRNIEVANAIEALGCWLALHHNGWGRDPRIRGANKMRHAAEQDLSFDRVRKPRFYVTQPMTMPSRKPMIKNSRVLAKRMRNAINGLSGGCKQLEMRLAAVKNRYSIIPRS